MTILIPKPQAMTLEEGFFFFSDELLVKGDVLGLTQEWLEDLERLWGMKITLIEAKDTRPHLTIKCKKPEDTLPLPTTMERYQLHVTPTGISIDARTPHGLRYGFQSLLQLASDNDGLCLPAVTIEDEPRFKWRGLMLDVGRHFMPMDLVKRVVDTMGRLKLNVLHFGLSNNQGFRVESKRFPRLHEVASGGKYFTQDEIKDLVAYAGRRGVRVVPEFNMPGHSTAFLVAYPELASGPAPATLQTTSGVFDDEMNPASPHTDKFVGEFIKEMVELFPDPYWHFGGDEVTGKSWDDDPSIQSYMKEMGLEDNKDLQALFTMRVQGHLANAGRKSAAWEEVVEGLPSPDTLIMPWITPALDEKFKDYPLVVCAGYYLDHFFKAADYYAIDPEPEDEERDVLGAEMCVWSEVMDQDNVEPIILSSVVALAERFWSPRELCDIEGLQPRIDATLGTLEKLGGFDTSAQRRLAERLCGGALPAAVQTLRDYVGPHVYYFALDRSVNAHDVNLPFDRLIETLRPETGAARRFDGLVDDALAQDMTPLKRELSRLTHLGEDFARATEALASLQENQAIADTLAELATETLKLLAGEQDNLAELLDKLDGPREASLSGAVESLRRRRDSELPLILRETVILVLPALRRLL